MIGVVKLNIMAWDSGNLRMLEIKSYWLHYIKFQIKLQTNHCKGIKRWYEAQTVKREKNPKRRQTETRYSNSQSTCPQPHMCLAGKRKRKGENWKKELLYKELYRGGLLMYISFYAIEEEIVSKDRRGNRTMTP